MEVRYALYSTEVEGSLEYIQILLVALDRIHEKQLVLPTYLIHICIYQSLCARCHIHQCSM